MIGAPFPDHGIWSWPGIITLVLVVFGVGVAWAMYGRVAVSALAPRGSVLTRAARADLYGDAFNESVLMRPGQWLTRLSVFFDSRGVDGLVNTLAATVGGSSSRLAQAAERFRALLRAVHAHRRRAARGRPSGGEALMVATSVITVAGTGGLPWLTVAGGIPLVGAIVVAFGPARLTRYMTLAFSVITLGWVIAMATQFNTSGPTFQFTEEYSWIPQFGVHYALGVDGIALVLLGMTVVLMPVVVLASWHDADLSPPVPPNPPRSPPNPPRSPPNPPR